MSDSILIYFSHLMPGYLTSAQDMAAYSIITVMERVLIQRGGEGGEGAATQLYSTDINGKICFVSADTNGKNKASSLLLYLCLVITWISTKISTQQIHLPCSSHTSQAINLSWLRSRGSCNIYPCSKSWSWHMSWHKTMEMRNIYLKCTDFHNTYLHLLSLQASFALI